MGRVLTAVAIVAACGVLAAGAQQQSTIAGATVPDDVRALIARAGAAMGMTLSGNTDNIATIEYWGSGTAGSSKVSEYHAGIDYSTPPGMRVNYVRDGQRRIEAVTADSGNMRLKFAWNESQPGGGTIAPAAAEAADRWRQFWVMAPQGVIKAAVLAGPAVKMSKTASGATFTFPFATGSCRDEAVFGDLGDCEAEVVSFTVTLDARELIETVNGRSGPLVMETTYSNYRDLSGTKSAKLFPSRIVHTRSGKPLWDLTISKADLDYPSVLVITPASIRTAKPQPRPGAR